MFERFTKQARKVVEDAAELARTEGASEVRPEHVLASVLEVRDSLAVQVLVGLGAPEGELRETAREVRRRYVDGLDEDDAEALKLLGIDLEDVVARMDRLGGRPGPRRGHTRFSRGSKKALELSLREALRLGDGFIGTEHLLLGLVRGGDRVVLDTLAAFGITADDVRAAVAAAERRRTG